MPDNRANMIRKLHKDSDCNISMTECKVLMLLANFDYDLVMEALDTCTEYPRSVEAYILNERLKRLEERK